MGVAVKELIFREGISLNSSLEYGRRILSVRVTQGTAIS